MPMTDAEILALKPKAKSYKVSIGKGAYISVMPNGRKYWRLRYRLNGKENKYALGVFPAVSVDQAKAARESAKALIRKGINPSIARREERAKSRVPRCLFRLVLSLNGSLTIEAGKATLTLTPAQTQALTAFLNSGTEKHSVV